MSIFEWPLKTGFTVSWLKCILFLFTEEVSIDDAVEVKAALNKYPWLKEGVDSFDVTQNDETSVKITFNSPRGMCTPSFSVWLSKPRPVNVFPWTSIIAFKEAVVLTTLKAH